MAGQYAQIEYSIHHTQSLSERATIFFYTVVFNREELFNVIRGHVSS